MLNLFDRLFGNPVSYLVLGVLCGGVSLSQINMGAGPDPGHGVSVGFGVSAGLCVLAAAYVHVNRKK